MTSSVSDAVEADEDADLRAARRASEGRAMVMTFAALDWIRYPVKSASTLICLCRTTRQVNGHQQRMDTHDQTCIPPSFASLLQIMCRFVSVNLMMHFFCSFSIDWMISGR
jgi:hypothetical protein